MDWIPIGAWIAVAVVAVVVLGFCAFEIRWKSRRLQRDLRELQDLTTQLTDLQRGLAAAQERIAATGLR